MHDPPHDPVPDSTSRLGRYELLAHLGEGGMGTVYRARAWAAAGITRDVCIKRIRRERLADPHAIERFISEAKLSMGLSHPHIVPVFDFGRSGAEYFLAMEWVDGTDLKDVLSDGSLTPEAAAHVALGMARALAHVHSRPDAIVHRDVKPSNVLLTRQGDVLLTDFGVASLGGVRGMAGTPGYMSPEQEDGATTGPPADAWALGVVLREMLTTDREGDLDDAPSPLRALVSKLQADRPSERLTMEHAAEQLEAFLAARRVESEASPRAELQRRVARRPTREVSTQRAFGADVSFLAEGDRESFSTWMTASTPNEPPRRPPPANRGRTSVLVALGLAAVVAGAVLGLRSAPRHDPSGRTSGRSDETLPSEDAPPAAEPHDPAVGTSHDPTTGAPSDAPSPPEPTPPPTLAPTQVEAPASPRPRVRESTPMQATEPPRPEPSREALEPGRLDVNAIPWAEVFLDGRSVGTTPILGLEVPAGPHELELVNEPLQARTRRAVVVEPGGRSRLVVRLP